MTIFMDMENETPTETTAPTQALITPVEKGTKVPQHPTFLTSVKILMDKYDSFKETAAADKLTLQKLVNRTVYLYINDPEFRKRINDTTDLQATGSSF
jgi:hypothetical protein